MKTRRVYFFILLLLSSLYIHSQNANADRAQAEQLFAQQRYSSALSIYQQLLANDSYNPGIYYKAGACYLQSRSQQAKAIPLLEKATELSRSTVTDHVKESDVPIDVYKMLGDAYYSAYRFDPAVKAYEKYKELLLLSKNKDQQQLDAVNNRIEICELGRELKDLSSPQPPDVVQEKNGLKNIAQLNGSAYSSTLSNDKSIMIVTLKIPVDRKYHLPEDFRYFDHNYDNHGKTEAPSYTLNTNGTDDTLSYATTIGASVDGQIVLNYRNEKDDAAISLSRLMKDKWSAPQRIGKSSGHKGWEPHEFVSADGNILFFVSEREGGYGGKDLYMCSRLPNGEWSKARNAGPQVNTPYDETAPFIHPNGQTLYFSSNRHKPYCFDIYRSDLVQGEWSLPVNVGYPVNRFESDIYEVSAKKTAAPSSNQSQAAQKRVPSEGKNNAVKDTSISGLLLTVSDEAHHSLILMTGTLRDDNGAVPPESRIIVTDNSNETTQGVYYPDKNGNFAFFLTAGKSNNIVFEAPSHLYVSENFQSSQEQYFEKRNAVVLQRLQAGSQSLLGNIFFESGTSAIRALSYPELNRLAAFLRGSRDTKVELKHSIYTKKDRKENKKLAKDRVNQLAQWLTDRGVQKEQITTAYERSKPGKKKNQGKEIQTKEGDARTTVTIR